MPRTCHCNDLDNCSRCRAYETHPSYAEWASGAARRAILCRHRGTETRCVPRATEAGTSEVLVFACSKHGECTTTPTPTLACCRTCPDADPDPFRLVAPLGTWDAPLRWEGRAPRKPWQYRVSVALPHLDTVDALTAVVDLLRLQTERPYILVLDTGSPPEACVGLERLRADDLEIHYLRGHAYMQSSAPVSVAQDVAQALCRTEWLYCTHTDVFPRRRDLLAWLLNQCNAACPAVGYGMSERSWATDLWQKCIGHQCLMLHMPTIRTAGVTWNMEHGYHLAGWTGKNAIGWPDTETGFSLDLLRRCIVPRMIGREVNFTRFLDENIDHARTFTGSRVYLDGPAMAQTARWMEDALTDAKARAAAWRAEGGPG